MYISRIVNIRSSLIYFQGFQLLPLLPKAHRGHLFCFYEQNQSSASKVKLTQVINYFKRVFEAAKISYADTKESITSQKLGSHDLWRIAMMFSTKVNLPYLLRLTDLRFRVFHLIRQNCFLKTFQRLVLIVF